MAQSHNSFLLFKITISTQFSFSTLFHFFYNSISKSSLHRAPTPTLAPQRPKTHISEKCKKYVPCHCFAALFAHSFVLPFFHCFIHCFVLCLAGAFFWFTFVHLFFATFFTMMPAWMPMPKTTTPTPKLLPTTMLVHSLLSLYYTGSSHFDAGSSHSDAGSSHSYTLVQWHQLQLHPCQFQLLGMVGIRGLFHFETYCRSSNQPLVHNYTSIFLNLNGQLRLTPLLRLILQKEYFIAQALSLKCSSKWVIT